MSPATPPLLLSKVTKTLPPDARDQALSFFNAFFIRGPREPNTNIWATQIIPRVINSSPDSLLALSTTAVAMQTLDQQRFRIMRSPSALKFYLKAVAMMRMLVQSSLEDHYEEILCGILMLETFENLSQIAGESERTAVHHNAGLQVVRHGLSLNLDATKTTETVASALQSRYVWTAFVTGAPTPLFALGDRSYPGVGGELDIYTAEAANILYERDAVFSSSSTKPSDLSALLIRTLRLLTALHAWHTSLPLSWRPHRLSATCPDIDPSIHAAGLYASLCEIYSSLQTSHSMAMYRVVHIAVLQTRWLLEHRLVSLGKTEYTSAPSKPRTRSLRQTSATPTDVTSSAAGSTAIDPGLAETDTVLNIQVHADALCAAVPFHLGNRLSTSSSPPTPPDASSTTAEQASTSANPLSTPALKYKTHYPPSSLRLRKLARFVDEHGRCAIMTDAAHATEAAAKGVFMILVPLDILLRLCRHGETLLLELEQGQGRQRDDHDDAGSTRNSTGTQGVTGETASTSQTGQGNQTETQGKGNGKQQQSQQQKTEAENPFRLRDGQLQWIEGQVARAAGIQMRPMDTN